MQELPNGKFTPVTKGLEGALKELRNFR